MPAEVGVVMRTKFRQQFIKANPIAAAAALTGKRVLIWSGEWDAYWRPDAAGYTDSVAEAGVYDWEDAWRLTDGVGPEKKIEYRLA